MLDWLIQQPLFPVFIYNVFNAIKTKDKTTKDRISENGFQKQFLEAEITLKHAIDLQLININDIYGKTYLRSNAFLFEMKSISCHGDKHDLIDKKEKTTIYGQANAVKTTR